MSQNIVYQAFVEQASDNYGRIKITNIEYEDKSPVTVKHLLGLKFKSPSSKPDPGVDVNFAGQGHIVNVTHVDNTLEVVTAKITVQESHKFGPNDTIYCEINGDLKSNPKFYSHSFEFFADNMPSAD